MSAEADALMALSNRMKKVDIPNFEYDVYVRPISFQKMMEISIQKDGESTEERSARIEVESNAYSLCNKDGEQLLESSQYEEFSKNIPLDVGLAILKAKTELNDFNHLDADAKKK